MKKQKIVRMCIAVLMAAFILAGFLACEEPDSSPSKSNAADLTSIKIGNTEPTSGGTPVSKIPTAITSSEWGSTTYSVANADKRMILLDNAAALTGTITFTASAKSTVTFGTEYADKPTSFGAATSVTLASGIGLFVKVESESKKTTKYYYFDIQTKSATANLSRIDFGSISATAGTPAATYDAAGLVAGKVGLGRDQASGITVTATPVSAAADVKYAKVAKDATGTGLIPDFVSTNTGFSFADGDVLYIQVISEDTSTTRIYKILVEIGTVATLSDITFKGDGLDLFDGITLGEPTIGATEGSVVRIMIPFKQPVAGYTVTFTPQDPYAKVSYASAAEGASAPSVYSTAKSPSTGAAGTTTVAETIQLVDSEILYIKVVSDNSSVTYIYMIGINFRQTVVIKKGLVEVENGVIDAAWASAPVLGQIKKIGGEFPLFAAKNKTHGEFKAMYDEEGLYVYAVIYDEDITTKTKANTYERDSLEVFVNEKWDASWGDNRITGGNAAQTESVFGQAGGQYRVAVAGDLSGHPAAATEKFTGIGRTSVDIYADRYEIVMQVPWRYLSKTQLETANFEIGLELQINACHDGVTDNGEDETTTVRDGTVVWNNVAWSNYQDVRAYGVGVLEGGPINFVNAAKPELSDNPASGIGNIGATKTFTAKVSNLTSLGGTISYQWYSGQSATLPGTAIPGATGAITDEGSTSLSYTTDTLNVLGTFYYYVVITHVDSSVSGHKTITTTSPRAALLVRVAKPKAPEWQEKITAVNASVPVFAFDIPGGEYLGSDYTKIIVEVKADDVVSTAGVARLRVWGAFPQSYFSAAGVFQSLDNAFVNGSLLTNGDATLANMMTASANDWSEQELDLDALAHTDQNNSGGRRMYANGDVNYPFTATARDVTDDARLVDGTAYGATLSGRRLFAVGFPGGAGSSGTWTYRIKNVRLTSADGSSKVLYALHPEDETLYDGMAGQLGAGNGSLKREIIDITPFAEKIETNAGATVPAFAFNIPAGESIGTTYTKVSVKVKSDSNSTGSEQRLRAWGAFPQTYWNASATNQNLRNATPAGALLATGTELLTTMMGESSNDWCLRELDLTAGAGKVDLGAGLGGTGDVVTANWPTETYSEISGIRLLCIGFAGPGSENGIKIYHLKEVELISSDGMKRLKAIRPDDDGLYGGMGGNICANGNGASDPTHMKRTIYFED